MVALNVRALPRPVAAVLLAGAIRPSILCAALDIHVLCLPVRRSGCLLDAWLDVLGEIPELGEVLVVVNTQREVEAVNRSARISNGRIAYGMAVRTIAEPAAWRGAGGILRDVTRDLSSRSIVLACEAKRLPPSSVLPLVEPFEDDLAPAGVIGVCGRDEPAGVCAFDHSTLDLAPRIGYFDMKEQFLPAICTAGGRVITASLGDQVWRLNDLDSYLTTVRQSLRNQGDDAVHRVSPQASVSGSAVLNGFCIVEAGAVIEDGAVVHDTVLLGGGTIGGGAVVSRSVIGPLAQVEPRSRVVGEFVTSPQLRHSRYSFNSTDQFSLSRGW
jgi:hypothetical protein